MSSSGSPQLPDALRPQGLNGGQTEQRSKWKNVQLGCVTINSSNISGDVDIISRHLQALVGQLGLITNVDMEQCILMNIYVNNANTPTNNGTDNVTTNNTTTHNHPAHNHTTNNPITNNPTTNGFYGVTAGGQISSWTEQGTADPGANHPAAEPEIRHNVNGPRPMYHPQHMYGHPNIPNPLAFSGPPPM